MLYMFKINILNVRNLILVTKKQLQIHVSLTFFIFMTPSMLKLPKNLSKTKKPQLLMKYLTPVKKLKVLSFKPKLFDNSNNASETVLSWCLIVSRTRAQSAGKLKKKVSSRVALH